MRRRYVAFETVFAICSAISSVQEWLGVRRHAASGSAATNPEGTIKLHLNKAGSREQGEAREERRKERGWGRGTQGKEERRDPGCIVTEKGCRNGEWGGGRS